MTDTTLYAGLVGQKLHGTIRTNGLAYGGAMKSSKKIVALGGVAVAVVATLYGIFAGNIIVALLAILALVGTVMIFGRHTGQQTTGAFPADMDFGRSMFSMSIHNPWDRMNRKY